MDFADLETLKHGQAIGAVNVLMLSESGYVPINPPEWIANLHPQIVIISVNAANREGLPSPETLDILQGYTLLRTDQNGWIHLSTDGQNMWVEVEIKY
jgi:competence protein ComEC